MEQLPQSDNLRPNRHVKTTLIEPFKQVKFGMYVIGLSLVFVVLSGLLFYDTFIQQYKHVMKIFNVVDPDAQWELITDDIFKKNLAKLGVLLVGYLGIISTVIFRLTHKYYGPLVSIERFVDDMTRGDYTKRVTIRKKDELQRLAAKLNEMANILEARHAETPNRRKSDTSNKDAAP